MIPQLLYRLGWSPDRIYIGVEVLENGYRWLLVERKQQQLLLCHRGEGRRESLIQFLEKWPLTRLILYYPSKERIQALVEYKGEDDLLSLAIGARVERPESLVYQQIPGKGDWRWVSVMRKVDLGNVLDQVPGSERIFGLELSNLGASHLVALIDGYREDWTYRYRLMDDSLVYWQHGFVGPNSSVEAEIDSIWLSQSVGVDQTFLGLYGAVVRILTHPESGFSAQDLFQKQKRTLLKREAWTKLLWRITAATFLLAMFSGVSLFLLSHQRKKMAEQLHSQVEWSRKISHNQAQIKEIQEALRPFKHSLKTAHPLTYYLESIAKLVPSQVRLITWCYQPTELERRRLPFQWRATPMDMLIGGVSSPSLISEFLVRLEQQPYVSRVYLVDNGYDRQTDQSNFYLLIQFSAT